MEMGGLRTMTKISEPSLISGLKAFAQLSEEVRLALVKRVTSTSADSLFDPGHLREIEEDVGIPPRVLRRAFPGLVAVAHFAKREDLSYADELRTRNSGDALPMNSGDALPISASELSMLSPDSPPR
jgi:hypothetical protein